MHLCAQIYRIGVGRGKLTNQQQQQKYWTQTNESVNNFFPIGLKYIETREWNENCNDSNTAK